MNDTPDMVDTELVEALKAMPVDKRIQYHRTIKADIERLEEECKNLCAPLQKIQDMLEGSLQEKMDADGVRSIRTKLGTVFLQTDSKVSVADPDIFMNYVIENNKFDLIDRRANKTAVKDFVEKNKEPPPGCNYSTSESVHIRKPTGKDAQ